MCDDMIHQGLIHDPTVSRSNLRAGRRSHSCAPLNHRIGAGKGRAE